MMTARQLQALVARAPVVRTVVHVGCYPFSPSQYENRLDQEYARLIALLTPSPRFLWNRYTR